MRTNIIMWERSVAITERSHILFSPLTSRQEYYTKHLLSCKRQSDEMIFTPSHINLYTSQMNLHGDIIQTNWLSRVKEQDTIYCFPVLVQLSWNGVPYHLESCSISTGTRVQITWNSSTDKRQHNESSFSWLLKHFYCFSFAYYMECKTCFLNLPRLRKNHYLCLTTHKFKHI